MLRIILATTLASVLLALAPLCTSKSPGQEKGDATPKAPLQLIRGRVVDEEGIPIQGALIRTFAREGEEAFETKSTAGGVFLLRVKAPGHYLPSFLVSSPDETLLAWAGGFNHTTDRRNKSMKVVLQPPRKVVAKIVNTEGEPVSGATVFVQVQYREILRVQSNKAGEAQLTLPANAKVDWINAFKDEVGYDYFENYEEFSGWERGEVPEQVTLTLDGATSITLEALDTSNAPLEGVTFSPWTIQKAGKKSDANIGGCAMQKTGKDGTTTFTWIPSKSDPITFLSFEDNYYCPKSPTFRHAGEAKLTATFFRKPRLFGQLTYDDGTPAAGIRLQGEGRGASNHYFRGNIVTDSDGRYEMKIYPDQETIVAVMDDAYAAESITGILLKEGEEKEVNLSLTTGTLIRGQVTDRIGAPVTEGNATLIQQSGKASLVRWSQFDANGEFQFRVGPGEYEFWLPGRANEKIQVTDETEIVRDHSAKLKKNN